MTGRRARPAPGTALVAFLGCLASVLAACGGGGARIAQAPPDPGPHPVVAVGQAAHILDLVDGALLQAQGNPRVAGTRAAGPYRDILTARQRVLLARKLTPAAAPAPDRTRLIVPTAIGWPRFFVSVGSSRSQATPVLRVLVSTSARSPYALWAELTMLPGATLPAVAAATDGAPQLPPQATGFLVTPQQAVAQYADVLSNGAKSRYAVRFARNTFTDQVVGRVSADRAALARVATVTAMHQPVPGAVYALRTAGGGALVIGEIRQQVSITVRPKAGIVKVSDPSAAALAGRAQFAKRAVRTAVEVVALLVPPPGHAPVTVIAALKADVAVTGS